MKQIPILIILFISAISIYGQSKKYTVEVNISSRVDTLYNQEKKDIYYLFKNYLEARPDSFYNNPFWTNKEKVGPDSSVISEFYKGFYSLQLPPDKLFANWKPFILTIENLNEKKYRLRIALISDTLSSDKILTILNINAIKENNKWVLENTFKDVVNSWQTRQFKYIKYVYPSDYQFNEKLAQKSVMFCDSIAKQLKINKIDSFTYFICDNPDKMGLLFGFEFYNQNYTTGMTSLSTKRIFSAKRNEFYPHEFMHMVLNNSIKDTMDYLLQEGLCCFLGEFGTERYEDRFFYLADDYLKNKPTYTLHHLLTNTANYNGYSTAYSTGSVIIEIIYDKKGFEGIIQLLKSNSGTEEYIYKTIYAITKLNKVEFEKEFRKKLIQHIRPNGKK
jgi:hypothetical protein